MRAIAGSASKETPRGNGEIGDNRVGGLDDRALADARLGRFDVLLVYRVDRFARSLKVLVGLLEELESAGVAFRSATEPIDTSTATGRMLVQLLGVFAEFERATIIDRVINGMERKAARGGWPGGPLPYGLALDDAGHLCASEGLGVVNRIFTRYAEGNDGAAALAAELNAEGLRTRTGRPWSAKVVLDVLRNRTYLGQVHFPGDWYPSAEAPFIDPKVFETVQALLDKRGDSYRQRFTVRRPEYLLTGLVRCGKCKRRYVGVAGTGKRHRYRYYMCWTRSRYGPGACDAERLRADELEEEVLVALVETYGHPVLLRRSCAGHRAHARQGIERHQGEVAALDAELRKTEAAVERYMLAFENGTVTEAAFGPRVRELGAQAQLLRVRRDEAASALKNANGAKMPTVKDLRALHARLRSTVETGNDTVRKAVARAFVAELVVEARDRILPSFRVLDEMPDAPPPAERPQGRPKTGVRTNDTCSGRGCT